MPTIARRVEPFGTTIFTEINLLAQRHNALNLGQGKPDFDPPPEVAQALQAAAASDAYHQYPPAPGVLELRQAIADHQQRFYGLTVDPETGVLVTVGATEGIFAAILGLVDAGDEVILIEPCYDSYVPNVLMAGAVPVFVPLRPPEWTLDPTELRAAFSSRTRALVLNTPHNPTGRVLTRAELEQIAALCQEFDVTVIADEVYEHLLFDDARHIPIATLPGMFERTVTVSSAGKTFSVTGWKIGWVSGPPNLLRGIAQAHQFITFDVNHPAQIAVIAALRLPDAYFQAYRAMYAHKRALLLDALDHAGFTYQIPAGAYYVLANYAAFSDQSPMAFARSIATEIGVAGIPPETFFSAEHASLGFPYIRFAFCKQDAMLAQVGTRLAKLRS